MPWGEELTRRSVIRAGIGGIVGAGSLASEGVASRTIDETNESPTRIPPVPVDDRTETVPASVVPERASGIRPGSQIIISDGSSSSACTANFIWEEQIDGGDNNRYLGAAGHCFLGISSLESPNVATKGDPAFDGLEVSVCTDCTFGGQLSNVAQGSAVSLGEVVYARQAPPGGGNGIGHDFGLVEIPSDAPIDPSLPQFGGPTGRFDNAVPTGQRVGLYGAGIGNGEAYLTQARRGLSLGGNAESWSAAIRATPGDSGASLVSAAGWNWLSSGPQAAGILTHGSTSGIGGTTMQQCIDLATGSAYENVEEETPIESLELFTPSDHHG